MCITECISVSICITHYLKMYAFITDDVPERSFLIENSAKIPTSIVSKDSSKYCKAKNNV